MKRKSFLFLTVVILLFGMTGCTKKESDKAALLSKNKPVTIVLWNYYNGQTKTAFDALVSEFNETIGMEQGIIVDAFSQGDLNQLANAVYDAASKKIGSEAMPHIFGGYPDNVFRVDQLGQVADLDQYFTKEEQATYRESFMSDCRLGEGDKLKLIPVARSTEVLYLNETDWNSFAASVHIDTSSLATWEGVMSTAEKYYEWTDAKTKEPGDGKAFLGLDSITSFLQISSMQLDQPIYEVNGTKGVFHFDRDFAKTIWTHLYIPYIKGYFKNYGKFRSDDAKTGDILAYIASSAGAQYFPVEVSLSPTEIYPVFGKVLPYPYFKDGTPYAIAQGAGFAVAKSDKVHEYAATEFLKWFTEKEQNIQFSTMSGYLPVKNDALEVDLVAEAKKYNEQYGKIIAVDQAIETTQHMLEEYELYSCRSFEGSFDLRLLFDSSILSFIEQDLEKVEQKVLSGCSREEAIEDLIKEENFEVWYLDLIQQVQKVLDKSV